MTCLLLGTSAGNVYLYDLPKAFENERIISRHKIEMGVEKELVYTHLENVNSNEYTDFVHQNTASFSKSFISNN